MNASFEAFLQHTPLQLSVLLQCAQQPQLVAEADNVVSGLPAKLRQEAQQLLTGLPNEAVTLVVAYCMTRRGKGGPAAKPAPQSDGSLAKAAAVRIAVKRRGAALSKLRAKLANAAKQLSVCAPASMRAPQLRLNSSLLAVGTLPMKRQGHAASSLGSQAGFAQQDKGSGGHSSTSTTPDADQQAAAVDEQQWGFFNVQQAPTAAPTAHQEQQQQQQQQQQQHGVQGLWQDDDLDLAALLL